MKKTLLLILLFVVCSVNAQITISNSGSNCNFSNTSPMDTYSISGIVNGRNSYISDNVVDCSQNLTQAYCLSTLEYRIEWSGTEWQLMAYNVCDWELGEECVPNGNTSGGLYATNSANTMLPPNGDWVSSDYIENNFDCNFILSGGEDITISVTGSCSSYPNAYGDYISIPGEINNGKNVYTKTGTSNCFSGVSQSTCAGVPQEYRIYWTGTAWILEYGACVYDSILEECIISYNIMGTGLAFNNSDTNFPPNGTWNSNVAGCDFTISGGEVALSTEEVIKTDYKIVVYPNPTTGQVTLDFGKVVRNATLKLYNTKGQVLTTSTVFSKNKETLTIDQSAGVYFINVTLENGNQFYYKVVKK